MERNEILSNFQTCSGIEDISECVAHLEQCDWNLNEAVSAASAANSIQPPLPPREVPQDLPAVQTLFPQFGAISEPSTSITNFTPPPLPPWEVPQDISAVQTVFPQFEAISEPSTSKTRTIHFEVHLGTITKHVSLDETARLADFRQLASTMLGIPQTEAKFTGWPNPETDNMTDDTDLKSLHLPLNVTLTVSTTGQLHNGVTSSKFSNFKFRDDASVGFGVNYAVPCFHFQNFKLEITDKNTKKVYSLAFLGSKAFEELCLDAYSLTGVPPSKQRWEGLASSHSLLTPNRTLGSLNLNIPVHKCAVSSRSEGKMISSPIDLTAEDDDMEIDMFEDESDDWSDYYLSDDLLFKTESPTISPFRPLMPEQSVDETAALVQFQSEFNSRYGGGAQLTPIFFLGSLDDAVQEAFGSSARDRRLLAIYLHHDKSIQSNVFCSQLLCAPLVVEYMMSHCVTWAWDVTLESNKRMLLNMCTRLLGSGVSDTVKGVPQDRFPMLILAQRCGGSCEVHTHSIIQGYVSLNELMDTLIEAVDDADHHNDSDRTGHLDRRNFRSEINN